MPGVVVTRRSWAGGRRSGVTGGASGGLLTDVIAAPLRPSLPPEPTLHCPDPSISRAEWPSRDPARRCGAHFADPPEQPTTGRRV